MGSRSVRKHHPSSQGTERLLELVEIWGLAPCSAMSGLSKGRHRRLQKLSSIDRNQNGILGHHKLQDPILN
jgi:hypothetical protein